MLNLFLLYDWNFATVKQQLSIYLSAQPLANIILLRFYEFGQIPHIKWKYAIFIFLWLSYFT